MDLVEFLARYLIIPVATIACTLGWHMIKKQEDRIDTLEARANDVEKGIVELRTEIRKDIQYLAQDVKEIKDILIKRNG